MRRRPTIAGNPPGSPHLPGAEESWGRCRAANRAAAQGTARWPPRGQPVQGVPRAEERVSSYPIGPQMPHAPISRRDPTAATGDSTLETAAECLEFVRFCYRRRHVSWPALYDEMCHVAARGAFRGMGYSELAEHGISFCLPDLPAMAALTERVIREERTIYEPQSPEAQVAINLAVAPARG